MVKRRTDASFRILLDDYCRKSQSFGGNRLANIVLMV